MGSVPHPSPTAEVLCQIVTPVGMLGYGFPADELYRGLELARQNHPGVPTAIVLDSGSTDSGPSKLALGSMTCPESAYRRDLLAILRAARQYGVPLLLSSAGGDGEDEHVRLFGKIVEDVAQDLNKEQDDQKSTRLKVVSVFSTLDKALVLERLQTGAITGCGPCVPALTPEALAETTVVVGQMGPEPFVEALAAHPDADVVLGGRAYDPSPYVAYCAHNFLGKSQTPVVDIPLSILGGFTHMGKIMECGGLCATPKSRGSMATVYKDGTFDIRPLAPGAVCQPLTVAAHTLYEKARPDHLAGPGGILDLTTAKYAQLDDGLSVHIAGATFIPSNPYTVKLEGARVTGYRTIFMGSFCDPILISQLPSMLERVKGFVAEQNAHLKSGEWDLDFHVYDGKDHDGDASPSSESVPAIPGVVFIVGEALAITQADANGIASAARIACVHGPYPGQKANSGNFGMGIGGCGEVEMGACAEFSVYHLMDLQKGEEGAVEVAATTDSEDSNESNRSRGSEEKKGLFRFKAVWAGASDGQRTTELPFRVDPEKAALVNTKAVKSGGANGVNGVNGTTTTTGKTTLGDLAKILRSKNSGPFEITLDVLFDDAAVYEQVKASNTLTPKRVASLYGLQPDQLVYCGFFDQALAFKATLPRMRNGKPMASGGFMENDVHGSQKYKPLMNLVVEL
ncbi:hypothetical protein SBRCBS47491_005627 [Sporothrix bragantina]|uniref:Caib baif family enzyme n=1 Tax=Sporothrix bragantina TaxID=671064 RepID=A0ABP0BYI8_9PEZI